MKINLIIYIIFFAVINTIIVDSIADDRSNNFKILFWGKGVEDIENLKDLTYTQLISKYKPVEILIDEYIRKYYWDEQVLEIDRERYENDVSSSIIGSSSSYFTIVLHKKIIYHGISRTVLPSIKMKYHDSNYPAITYVDTINKKLALLILKPRLKPASAFFRDYTEKDKKKLLNQEVLGYFKEQNKITRGRVNLEKLYGYWDEDFDMWILR